MIYIFNIYYFSLLYIYKLIFIAGSPTITSMAKHTQIVVETILDLIRSLSRLSVQVNISDVNNVKNSEKFIERFQKYEKDERKKEKEKEMEIDKLKGKKE